MRGIIERLEFNKKVSVYSDGKKYVAKTGFPGEIVEFSKARKNRVKSLEVIETPYKKISACSVQERCGGCRFRELVYEDEKKIKERELARLFDDIMKRDSTEFLGLNVPAKIQNYRNKMEYTFGDEEKDGPLTLGLHEKGKFHNIVEGDDCLIVPDDMTKIRIAIREYFSDKGIKFYHRFNKDGYLRHLVVRHSVFENSYLLNLVTTSQFEFPDDFVEFLESIEIDGVIKSVYHTINDSLADNVEGEAKLIYGEKTIRERILGLSFEIGPFSFFQTNTLAAEELYAHVKMLTKKSELLWDLYAGSAVIGQILSDSAKQVVSVEINPANVLEGKLSIDINGIKNIEIVEDDCKNFVETADKRADMIVIDPPRAGINKKVLEALDNSGVDSIIYVSCNPVTMHGDLQNMKNYRLDNLKGFDNFAGTLNVECVGLLKRRDISEE